MDGYNEVRVSPSLHRLYEEYRRAWRAAPASEDQFAALREVSDLKHAFIERAVAEEHSVYTPIAHSMVTDEVRWYEFLLMWEDAECLPSLLYGDGSEDGADLNEG